MIFAETPLAQSVERAQAESSPMEAGSNVPPGARRNADGQGQGCRHLPLVGCRELPVVAGVLAPSLLPAGKVPDLTKQLHWVIQQMADVDCHEVVLRVAFSFGCS